MISVQSVVQMKIHKEVEEAGGGKAERRTGNLSPITYNLYNL